MSNEVRAGLIALLLVIFAAGIGVTVGIRARPAPTPRPVPSPTTIALPTATPLDPAEVQRRAFAQPLTAGCATSRAVWLFADGGAPIRYDGRTWTIPDPTLRSLLAAQCDQATALAVGRGGSMVTIDDELRQLRVDRFGIDDLVAVSRVPGGAVAVGDAGTVAEQGELGWRLVPAGATADLRGVVLPAMRVVRPGRAQAWIVGAGGASHRLVETGWEKVETGTAVTLRAVVQQGDVALAVGDRGTVLRSIDGGWAPVPSGTEADLRAVAVVGATAMWIVGDRGTVIELQGESARRVDIGTTCTLRAVFADGSAVWVVGSDGVRGGAWRIAPTGTDRWGTC